MSSTALLDAVRNITEWERTSRPVNNRPKATEIFGSLTFNDEVQKRRLPRDVYRANFGGGGGTGAAGDRVRQRPRGERNAARVHRLMHRSDLEAAADVRSPSRARMCDATTGSHADACGRERARWRVACFDRAHAQCLHGVVVVDQHAGRGEVTGDPRGELLGEALELSRHGTVELGAGEEEGGGDREPIQEREDVVGIDDGRANALSLEVLSALGLPARAAR